MANYATLKAAIQDVVKTNGNNEITGALLQQSLLAMINSLGAGYQFMGVAVLTPTATNPGTPDQNVFYIASESGTYSNFGGLSVSDGEVAILKYNGTWTKEVTGAATAAQVTQLGQKVDEFAQGKFYGYFANAEDLPTGERETGFAYVGTVAPFAVYNYDGTAWVDSGVTIDRIPAGNGEDIDYNAEGLLRFADRNYNAQNPGGMGYVILRKNKTFAEQVTLTNTIYEIRYPFDLGGASVTIPAGCVLRFNGGKIINGTIVGNGAKIESAPVMIFSSCTVTGCDCDMSMPEWFGAKADGVTDDTNAVNLSISAFRQVMLVSGRKYLINGTINMPYNGIIVGGYNTTVLSSLNETSPIFKLGYGCQVRNLKIEMDTLRTAFHIDTLYVQQTYREYDTSADAYKYETSAKIRVRDVDVICKNNSSSQVNCIESLADGFGVGYWQISFESMTIHGDYEYAIYLDNGNAVGTSTPNWQTDLTFRGINIGYSRNGIFIGKQDAVNIGSGMPPERVTFDGVSMQYVAGTTTYFAVISAGNRIIFQNCEPWDWVGSPFSVDQGKTNGVTINGTAWYYGKKNVNVTGNIAFGGVPAELYVGNNTGVYLLQDFFEGTRITAGKIQYNELTSLPIGCYYIPAETKWRTFLGAGGGSKILLGYYPAILRISRIAYNTTFVELFTSPNLGVTSAFSGKKRKTDAGYAYLYVGPAEHASSDTIPGWLSSQPELTLFDNLTDFLDTDFYRYLREGFIGTQYGSGNNAPRFALKVTDSVALDALGHSFSNRQGTTPPAANSTYDAGKPFYLTDKKRPIFCTGSAWLDAFGNAYDATTSGNTASRPSNVVDGFFYFDTDLNKPIWKSGNGWVDATGASV